MQKNFVILSFGVDRGDRSDGFWKFFRVRTAMKGLFMGFVSELVNRFMFGWSRRMFLLCIRIYIF